MSRTVCPQCGLKAEEPSNVNNLKSQCITWMIISLIIAATFVCYAYEIGKLKSELYRRDDYSSNAIDITNEE